jgi:hypothetical protein
MPYLGVKFTQGVSKGALDINFGQEGISRVRIHSWGITGAVAPVFPCFFLQINNQPTGGFYGNNGSFCYPLFPSGAPPNIISDINEPIFITEGDNIWNNSHRLEYELFNYAMTPLAFTDFYLVLQFETRDPFETRAQPPHDFQQYKETKQEVTRNVRHLPDAFYLAK